MFAVIKTGGKQYKVSVGDKLKVEKLAGKEGESVKFSEVLMKSENEDVAVGAPFIESAEVEARILSHGKGEKVKIWKYKAKKRYQRRAGFRQPFTEIEITAIK